MTLAMDASSADTRFVPEAGRFQATEILQQICGNYQSTSGHTATNVKETFVSESTPFIATSGIRRR